jgi:exosortase A
MVAIWSSSDTFAHGFLVLPISIWLIWTYRYRLHGLAPAPSLLPLWLMLPPAVAWLLAQLVGVNVIQQLAFVCLLLLGIWAVLGHQLTYVLAFPLFFLFFAVPMGEGLVPPMMEFTASSTVWLIQVSGVPVYREGLNFTLPSGAWSVVEACSGVRYIIASVTVGTLYAYLTYVSLPRRLIFIAISAVLPVFANTARAYLIVMLGHFSDMKIAVGVDHLIYGWVFFGIVIFLLFWVGSFFREDEWREESSAQNGVSEGASASTPRLVFAVLAALAVAGLPALMAATRLAPVPTLPLAFELPVPAVTWQRLNSPQWHWRPVSSVGGSSSAYYNKKEQPVGLFVQYADGTLVDADVIGSADLLVKWHSGTREVGKQAVEVGLPSGNVALQEVYLDGRDGQMLVWSWYLVDGYSTANEYEAKVRQLIARLSGRFPHGFRLILTTPMRARPENAHLRLQDYLDLHGDELYQSLESATAVTP